MAALFVVRPVGENGFCRHQGVNEKQRHHGRTRARGKENKNGEGRKPHTKQRSTSHEWIVTGFHTEPGSAAEQRLLFRLKDDRRRIDGDGRNPCAAAPAKVSESRI